MIRPIVMLVVAALALAGCGRNSSDAAPPAQTTPPTTTHPPPPPTAPPMLGNPLPLTDLDGWLQTDITSLEDLQGNVVIVQFWIVQP